MDELKSIYKILDDMKKHLDKLQNISKGQLQDLDKLMQMSKNFDLLQILEKLENEGKIYRIVKYICPSCKGTGKMPIDKDNFQTCPCCYGDGISKLRGR
jgi:ferredoxin-thioredoxin reductase catalytic subunit